MTEPEAMNFLRERQSSGVDLTSVTFSDGIVFSGDILRRVRISLDSGSVKVVRDVP